MLTVVPLSLADARAAVTRLHRHHRPPQGHKFSLGVLDDGTLCGAAVIGRPVSRVFDNGWTLEVTRVATDGTPNACSALYGAAWRTVAAAGYLRLITYTQHGESGSSLRAAGWHPVAELRPRTGWDTPSRPRRSHGNDRIARTLWEQRRACAPALPEIAELRSQIHNQAPCRGPRCTARFPVRSGPGRPRLYCTPACRSRAYRARHTTRT
ncbi:XF1762 family protein [Kitasatospora sp. NPDC088783]|uniref:XF1762 family protein n=1 Tax=Kitasatospora sp. NPDC088783 TaxID=3364077 RepID=UPI0037F8A21C